MKKTKSPLTVKEDEVKARVARDWFAAYDTTQYIGNIDFAVAVAETAQDTLMANWLLWAEAKKGISYNIDESFVQLIMTIGRARTFDRQLPPRYLAAFDAGRIAFIPYEAILDVFTINDFNWNVAANNHKTKEFILLKERVSGILANEKLTFDYLTDAAELKKFILQNVAKYAKAGEKKFRITKNNFTHIYNKWRTAVKPTISFPDWETAKKNGIIDADFFLADILSQGNSTISKKLNILLQNDHYRQIAGKDNYGQMLFAEIQFSDGQKAHSEFWRRYERPPKKEYWDYIINRRDLLVPQDIRETKGAFFTPRPWVELSQEYLARALGEDWQDEYYIWDCCAGTGNLLAGLVNKKNIWASTLEQQDVNVMLQRIENMKKGLAGGEEGANIFPSHVFKFDFLNDPLTKLPEDLQKIINDPEKRKNLVIYINPPYAEAASTKTKSGTGENKSGVAANLYNKKYKPFIGAAVNELFALFLMRIHEEIPGCFIGQFSKLKHVQAPNFAAFRAIFNASLCCSFLVPADTFNNVKGKFPIGFFVWRLGTGKEEATGTIPSPISLVPKNYAPFTSAIADVYNRKGELIGNKTICSNEGSKFLMDWIRQFYDRQGEHLAYCRYLGSDFQNNNGVFITLKPSPNDLKQVKGNWITSTNLVPFCVYFSVRHCMKATWLNDRDQFLYPEDSWKNDDEFHRDCLAYMLFHGQNRIRSEDGVNQWVPFSEDEMEAEDEVKSHFMIDILSGKTEFSLPEEEQKFLSFQMPVESENSGKTEFSSAARAVLDAALPIYKYYQAQPNANPNASFYDIRQYFQGVGEKGRMNNKSADEKYNQLLAELGQAQKRLAAKIADGVYRHGFLK